MKVAITGATGFVGSHLRSLFQSKGWEVLPIGRKELALEDVELAQKLQGVNAVINLAGANIAQRWNEAYKKILYESRIQTTRKIVSAMNKMETKPQVLISTSAVGIYSGEGEHTEESTNYGSDYLSQICRDWEAEAEKVKEMDIRTVIYRFGIVLGKGGGMLSRMLLPFKLGLGGIIGNGKQPFSWIHLEDLGQAILYSIEKENMAGIFNLVSPNPVDNREMTKTLARILKRPALFPVPLFMLRVIFSEGAVAIASGQRVFPKRLVEEGFSFQFDTIEKTLANIVN